MASEKYSVGEDLKGEVIMTLPFLTKSSVMHEQTEDALICSDSVFKFMNDKSRS